MMLTIPPLFYFRWPASTSDKQETDNWDAWAAQPSLTVPSAGQLRQRSAFTPATVTGSSPSPVLGQVSVFFHPEWWYDVFPG